MTNHETHRLRPRLKAPDHVGLRGHDPAFAKRRQEARTAPPLAGASTLACERRTHQRPRPSQREAFKSEPPLSE